MELRERVALVTGAGQGLGRSIALALAGNGARLVLNDMASKIKQIDEVAGIVRSGNGQALAVPADISNPAEVCIMFEQSLREFGAVDILVNNAGMNRNGLVREGNLEDWETVLSVNLTGTLNCMRAVLNSMRQRNYGRVINISSVVGMTGIAGTPYYAASKAGVIGLTKAAAAEVARRGITVNAIAAGYIDTGMGSEFDAARKEQIKAHIPLGRFATPQEIAYVACFLASEKASYITGTVINVSGGFYM